MKRIVRRSHLSEAHRLIIQLVTDGEKSEVVAKKCNTTSDNVRHVMSRYVKAVRKELEELAAEDVLLTREDFEYLENAKLLKSLCS